IFRADGSSSIGMGHFIRTLALAEMLKDDFHCIYATRQPTEYQIREIEKVCHERIDLPGDDSHFEYFLTLLGGDEIVVLDNYYFDTDYQRSIKSKGCKLVCIDDMHDKHYVADVLINHAEGIKPTEFSIEISTRLLLGYKYALVREVFLKVDVSKNKDYACLVMLGGADPLNITPNVVSILSEISFDKPIAVIAGAENKEHDKFHYFANMSAPQVADIMQRSEFAILPASTVAIEACAVRLPFICGYFVDNQFGIYNGICNEDLALGIGDLSHLKENELLSAVEHIKNNKYQKIITEKQSKLLDKHIKERYIDMFCSL
ncbi:MAG: UDP-2,4-diacetamido-2,4,6-trideoxy-beta-L-altropyranose hydrolase, partial [Bacteroidales bacterium]